MTMSQVIFFMFFLFFLPVRTFFSVFPALFCFCFLMYLGFVLLFLFIIFIAISIFFVAIFLKDGWHFESLVSFILLFFSICYSTLPLSSTLPVFQLLYEFFFQCMFFLFLPVCLFLSFLLCSILSTLLGFYYFIIFIFMF
jgi:hypothetical protein